MKAAVHDNVNPFLGICFNEKEELLLVWKFCNRLIDSRDLKVTWIFQRHAPRYHLQRSNCHGQQIPRCIYPRYRWSKFQSFELHVWWPTQGLEYLHASPIGYHGSLTPWSCLIDRNWMVKLTDYGIVILCLDNQRNNVGVAEPIERWEKNQWITIDELKSDDDKSNAKQKTSNVVVSLLHWKQWVLGALYDAPEMLKMRENNKVRRMDQVRSSLLHFSTLLYFLFRIGNDKRVHAVS